MNSSSVPSAHDLEKAADRLSFFIPETPVLRSEAIDKASGASLFFKMENLMPDVGAFKARGAMNALLMLQPKERERGIVTHSSGNHAQAIAWAAKSYKQNVGGDSISTFIVMPSNANEMKKRGVREFGGTIIECEPSQSRREEKVVEIQEQTGASIIHPFNDYQVIAGQSTAVRELINRIHALHDIVVPVGGGGLISGSALAAHYMVPGINVIGAEPEGANDAFRSMQTGVLQKNDTVNTIADGLLTSLGEKNFPIIQEFVDRIITVSDEEIIAAMRMMWERLRVIVEPSGAVPLAAILKQREVFKGKRVGVIVSGGNVDLESALGLFKANV